MHDFIVSLKNQLLEFENIEHAIERRFHSFNLFVKQESISVEYQQHGICLLINKFERVLWSLYKRELWSSTRSCTEEVQVQGPVQRKAGTRVLYKLGALPGPCSGWEESSRALFRDVPSVERQALLKTLPFRYFVGGGSLL